MDGNELSTTIGRFTVVIDRAMCGAYQNCVMEAPGVFELGSDRAVQFVPDPAEADESRLIEACQSCPVHAIRILGPDGTELLL